MPTLKSTAPSANGRVLEVHEDLRLRIASGEDPAKLARRYPEYFDTEDAEQRNEEQA
jgi:hypothetical protein